MTRVLLGKGNLKKIGCFSEIKSYVFETIYFLEYEGDALRNCGNTKIKNV